MLTLAYLCGPPGAGKSTLMDALTAACDRAPVPRPVPHDVLFRAGRPVAAEIGRRRETFSGTDALSMSIAPAAREWIITAPYRVVLAEGRRLASMSFLQAAQNGGYRVHLVYLTAPAAILAGRREARGSHQSESWMQGTASAAANLADAAEAASMNVHRLDASAAPAELSATLAALPGLEAMAA